MHIHNYLMGHKSKEKDNYSSHYTYHILGNLAQKKHYKVYMYRKNLNNKEKNMSNNYINHNKYTQIQIIHYINHK